MHCDQSSCPTSYHTLNHAFTLIEILMVVAVMGLLGSLLVTSAPSIQKKTAQVQSIANLKQWGQGIMLYVSDNGGRLPQVCRSEGYVGWDYLVAPYMNLTQENSASEKPPEKLTMHPRAPIPSDRLGRSRRSYAMPRGPDSVGRMDEAFVALASVTAPSKTILLTERPINGSAAYSASAAEIDYRNVGRDQPSVVNGQDFELNPGGVYNYLFVDGHTESIQPSATVGTGTLTNARGLWTISPQD